MPAVIDWIDGGLVKYEEGLRLQEEAFEKVLRGEKDGVVLFLEHEPVITVGKNSEGEIFREEDRPLCVKTDRGGKTTVHNPGQLVCYPILSAEKFKLTPKRYVSLLEASVIEVLQGLGLKGERDPEYPGVWVNGRKICALGVRFDRRVTRHGLALNVCNDLELFERIVPCGIANRKVTSLLQEGIGISCAEVQERLQARVDQNLQTL